MTSPPFRIMKTYTPQPLGKAGAMSHVFTRNTNPAEFHRHVIQAQNAFSFCNFHQSINHYNNAMEELNANLATTTLLQRATIHEIAGSYNNALNDAKAVIAIDSTLPDGYLSACNTLLLENKYREALLLSREGCQKADWDHPQYEALVELEKSISREVHKQNRWLMNKLPFDVIENVLRMLPLLSRVQLSLTCMDWNEFLCEWTGMWHDVWINHRISRSLPQFLDCVINSQVRTLIIDVEILDKLQSICLHAATHWRNLESLELHYFTQRQLVFPVIEANGSTLRHIRFKDTRGIKWAAEPIQYILKTCPNLKSLQCARDEYAAICPRMVTQPLYFDAPLRLTSLSITRTTLADYLDKLLPWCPDLQHIVLDAHDHDKPQRVEILDHVYVHCPKLVSLFYSGSGSFSYKKQGGHEYYNPHTTGGEYGLRCLVYIAGTTNESYKADKQIIRFLERSENTLEKLHVALGCQAGGHRLVYNYNPSGLEVIQHAAKLSFPQLQDLTIFEPPNRFIQPFNYQHGRQQVPNIRRVPSIPPTRAMAYLGSEDMCKLLAGSPDLTKVCIRSDTLVTDMVLEELAALRQLRHVNLGYATESMRESIYYPSGHSSMYPLPSYLQLDTPYRTVGPKEPSFSTQAMMGFVENCNNKVEELILSNFSGRLDDDLLDALAHSKSKIWRLVLGAPYEFTTRALIRFGQQMQDSVLTHLTIFGMDHELHRRRARIGNIMALTGLKHLIQLRLSLVNNTGFKSCKPILARFILASYNTSRITVIFQNNTSIELSGEYKRMALAQQECNQDRQDVIMMDEDLEKSLSPARAPEFHVEHVGRWMTTYELFTLNASSLHEQDI